MKKTFFSIIIFTTFLSANFIGINDGARSLGMGNAFVALSDDGSAVFYNPAGLARINQLSIAASLENPYGLSDLKSGMIAISFPTPFVRTGFAIQQISLVDEYSEQIFYLSLAGIIKIKNIPVRFGGSIKYESAKVENYENVQNPSNMDLDLGLLIDFTEDLFFGYSIKHLLEPDFRFISNSDRLSKKQSIGIYYNWRNSVNFLADYIWDYNNSGWNLGSEFWFYDVFAARLGMYDERLTAGFGLKTKKWSLDTATLSHEQLGSTYRIAFGINIDKRK